MHHTLMNFLLVTGIFNGPSCKDKTTTHTLLVLTRLKICKGMSFLTFPIFQNFGPDENFQLEIPGKKCSVPLI